MAQPLDMVNPQEEQQMQQQTQLMQNGLTDDLRFMGLHNAIVRHNEILKDTDGFIPANTHDLLFAAIALAGFFHHIQTLWRRSANNRNKLLNIWVLGCSLRMFRRVFRNVNSVVCTHLCSTATTRPLVLCPFLMATWLFPVHARLRLPSRLWLQARNHLNVALQMPSPASLEIETMPYPTAHPDPSVFEPMSEEYASVATTGSLHFTPLSSSATLASLVVTGDFSTAESLRKEMVAHNIPIPRDALYLRAALHAITQRHPRGSAKARMEAFEAWLSLVPDRHEGWQSFHAIRQRLFRTMDHLNLALVYRFGLVLASKGYYSGDAAMQVLSTLARYARPSVVVSYLKEMEDASRDYLLRMGMVPPSDLLACAYNLSIRTIALGGNGEAALGLIRVAQSRGVRISDFTLNIVAKHAPDRQVVINCVQDMYPMWTLQDTDAQCKMIPTGPTADIAVLAVRLRSLRIALRSPSPPSPHALHSFITSYQALRRTCALTLLRALAYRHSPKSASTWAFTEMLHHRSRRQPIHLLLVFSQHFHLVGVPRKTLLSFVRGMQGRQARKDHIRRWVVAPCPMKEKLWPSAYHTALVWEAIVWLSPKSEIERLYALLLFLVRQSRQPEQTQEPELDPGADPARLQLQLPLDTYDAAHFSPFVSAWARRRPGPTRAARILRDMVSLGIEPSVVQWSMVARGYAQHGDPGVALHILERLEKMGRGPDDNGETRLGKDGMHPPDMLLGIHTNVLRGFVLADDVLHAREVERRLVERLGYRPGERPATDASIALLRGLEERLEIE